MTTHNVLKGPRYDYTPDGKLARRTWARGVVTDYTYDNAGQLISTTYSDTTPTITMAYDRVGNLVNATTAGVVTNLYAYDLQGHCTNEWQNDFNLTRYYDTLGRSTGYAINGTRQTTIAYDTYGRIGSMSLGLADDSSAQNANDEFNWTYLPGSDLKASLQYPNGLTASWQYDANNQLLQVRNATPTNVISQFDYTYDAAGRRVSITKTGSAFGDLSGSVDSYAYNDRSELTSARRTKNGQPIPGFSEDFDYDPIGNRRSSATYNEKGEAQTSTYQANNLNQYTSRTTPGYAAVRGEADPNATVTVNENPTFRLGSYYFGSDLFDNSTAGGLANLETYATLAQTAANGDESEDLVSATTNQVYIAQSPESFAYDDDGNQTLITTKTGLWRVTYNGENRPVRWVRESDNTTIVMSYDHMGRRREKNAQRFFYDGYLQVCSYGSPTPTLNSNCYIWDPTEPIATRPLVWNRDSYASYYTHDGNKNVSEVIAIESEIFAHYEYAPFGANPLQYGISAADNPWRFSSDYADCDVALIYYNFRNYEPFSGGWVSRDPVDEVGGRRWFLRNSIELETEQLNLYQMVRSNPIENIDILGESGCRCGPEIGDILVKTLRRVENDFNNLRKRSILRAWWICTGIHLATTWDIDFDFISMPDGCAENECKDTFSVNGQCYNKWEINYILFGKISKLCDICRIQMEAMIAAHKIVAKPIIQTFSEEEYEWEYTHGVREWARIGRNMDGSLPQTLPNVDEKYSSCKSCDKKLEGWSNGFLTTWP